MLAYPEKQKRGKYLAYWLASRIVGQMIGGAMALGVNAHRKEKGHISVETYLVFIAIQAIGPFVASFLSPPAKVQRSDYSPVVVKLPVFRRSLEKWASFFVGRKFYFWSR